MPDTKTTAIAVVTMTVSIELHQGWGADCTLAQLQKQARDEAVGTLRGMEDALNKRNARIGEIRAIRVMFNEERLGGFFGVLAQD